MQHQTIEVAGFRCEDNSLDLSASGAMELALDQRAFGRHQLVVATADRTGRALGIAHCRMPVSPEGGLLCCLDTLRSDATAAAIAYSDEPVEGGPVSNELAYRLISARATAADQGVHLVDWIISDGRMIRSLKFGLIEGATWWDLPRGPAESWGCGKYTPIRAMARRPLAWLAPGSWCRPSAPHPCARPSRLDSEPALPRRTERAGHRAACWGIGGLIVRWPDAGWTRPAK
jgi:hypothetical protein